MRTFSYLYQDDTGLENFVSQSEIKRGRSQATGVLVQIFSCDDHPQNIIRLSERIQALLPEAIVIAVTTAGVIYHGEAHGLATQISISVFNQTRLKLAAQSLGKHGEARLGHSLADALDQDKLKGALVFSTAMNFRQEEMLEGFYQRLPECQIMGGGVGDNGKMSEGYLYADKRLIEQGALAIGLYSDVLTITPYWDLNWTPIGKKMKITHAEGWRVYSIDNKPAYQLYQGYLGLDVLDDFFLSVLEFPLILHREGMPLARVPVRHHEDGSLEFLADLKEGDEVQLSFGNLLLIQDSARYIHSWLKQIHAESFFIYSCGCRRFYLQDHIRQELSPFEGDTPGVGFFTYGEYLHRNDGNKLLNLAMTCYALSEGENEYLPPAEITETAETQDFYANKHGRVLEAFARFISRINQDYESELAGHQDATKWDKTSGLLSRDYFDEQWDRHLEFSPVPQVFVQLKIDWLDCSLKQRKQIEQELAKVCKPLLMQAEGIAIASDTWWFVGGLNIKDELRLKLDKWVSGTSECQISLSLSTASALTWFKEELYEISETASEYAKWVKGSV